MPKEVIEFSTTLDLKTREQIDGALRIYEEHKARILALPGGHLGFNAAETRTGSTRVCIWSAGDGHAGQAIAYVRDCATQLGLAGRWCLKWTSHAMPNEAETQDGLAIIDLATGGLVAQYEYTNWRDEQRRLAGITPPGGDPNGTMAVECFDSRADAGYAIVSTAVEPPRRILVLRPDDERTLEQTGALARRFAAAPDMEAILREAVDAWSSSFDGPADQDLRLSPSDLVEWFAGWRARAKAVLASYDADHATKRR